MVRTSGKGHVRSAAALLSGVTLVGLSQVASVQAKPLRDTPPLMTIKIFNDNPGAYIFPVLTTGTSGKDIWLQAIFKVPKAQTDTQTYPRKKNYRIYINPTVGIAPGTGVSLTLPLYTQLAANPDPTQPDQYIDWWNGGTVLLYSNTSATTPNALQAELTRSTQKEVTSVADGAVRPQCPKCTPTPTAQQPLKFYSDTSDLPKSDPTQLLEYTLGARVAQTVNNPNTDPPNTLDLQNVDFDVSYVNIGYLPAAMGPFKNNQVGYVGTPQKIAAFQNAVTQFLKAYPGWPRFVDSSGKPIPKIASPLELFARLAGANPPVDLEPTPSWPTKLWAPVQALRTNWLKFAGSVNPNGPGSCSSTQAGNTFCDAIVDAKKLLKANYASYVAVFSQQCDGTPVPLTDDLMISHVYGWTPFTEAATGKGCPSGVNLLEDTPGYSDNNYALFLKVKQEFDQLNYDTLPNSKYTFNPWVQFIHGKKYVNAPNVYAYSVDDAVGNIQASGQGFIIDVGSTKNLENPNPAAPPITINYAIDGPNGVKFTRYRVCSDDPSTEQQVNPNFASFIINANNPQNCPIYFYDNKTPAQKYTFTVTQAPPFKLFQDQSKASWSVQTATPIACTGNTGKTPYQPSSATWCCDRTAKNGVFAYSTPEPLSAHKTVDHYVITHGPEPMMSTSDQACSNGQLTR